MTRIFVFPLSDVMDQPAKIALALERHNRSQIGWGVAISEELPYEIRRGPIPLDFALYDRGKAVSVSRKRPDRRYETIFVTRRNDGDLSVYKKTYRNLVPECWLVNKKFVDSYEGILPASDSWKELKDRGQSRNKKLNEALRRTVAEDDVFVLVVSQPQEIRSKVDRLAKVVSTYRTAQRK